MSEELDNENYADWRGSADALVWAEQFIAHKEKLNWSLEDIDEGLMLAWFASAMMAMHDHVKRREDDDDE
jgi:hypothetical protein